MIAAFQRRQKLRGGVAALRRKLSSNEMYAMSNSIPPRSASSSSYGGSNPGQLHLVLQPCFCIPYSSRPLSRSSNLPACELVVAGRHAALLLPRARGMLAPAVNGGDLL